LASSSVTSKRNIREDAYFDTTTEVTPCCDHDEYRHSEWMKRELEESGFKIRKLDLTIDSPDMPYDRSEAKPEKIKSWCLWYLRSGAAIKNKFNREMDAGGHVRWDDMLYDADTECDGATAKDCLEALRREPRGNVEVWGYV